MLTIEELFKIFENNVSIIHADDAKVIRDGIRRILHDETPHLRIKASVSSYKELFKTLKKNPFDLLLLDGAINGETPDQYLSKIKKRYPKLKILILWLGSDENSLTKWINLIDGQLSLSA